MDAHQPVTLKEGDRYPLGPPSLCGRSSVGRASAFQAECRQFEPDRPLHILLLFNNIVKSATFVAILATKYFGRP
jgi:hypothetical protein